MWPVHSRIICQAGGVCQELVASYPCELWMQAFDVMADRFFQIYFSFFRKRYESCGSEHFGSRPEPKQGIRCDLTAGFDAGNSKALGKDHLVAQDDRYRATGRICAVHFQSHSVSEFGKVRRGKSKGCGSKDEEER